MAQDKYLNITEYYDSRELGAGSLAEVGNMLDMDPELLIPYAVFSSTNETNHTWLEVAVQKALAFLSNESDASIWNPRINAADRWSHGMVNVLHREYNNPESRYALTQELKDALANDRTVSSGEKMQRILDCMVGRSFRESSTLLQEAAVAAVELYASTEKRRAQSMGRIGIAETVDSDELVQQDKAPQFSKELAEALHKIHAETQESIAKGLVGGEEWGVVQEEWATKNIKNTTAVIEAISGIKEGNLIRHIDVDSWVRDAKAAYQSRK